MVGRPRTGGIPVEQAIGFTDRQVVDRGEPALHQTVAREFPVLVAIGTEPLAGSVVPLIGEADGDPLAGEGPELLDQPVVELCRPLAPEEGDDLAATSDEFGPVPPIALRRVGEGDAFGIAAVPAVL